MSLDLSDAAATACAFIAAAGTVLHLTTCAMAMAKVRRRAMRSSASLTDVAVTLLRPVCGLDDVERETLKSTFHLEHRALDIIFCVASETDPAVPYLRGLIGANPHVKARVLTGDERPTANPKLNNIVKGWRAAETSWIIMADSNVQMSGDYVRELLSAWDRGTGLVCSPPVGTRPQGIAAELECAILNSYQARWQLSADVAGFAFAQGKSMLWRRADLEAAGGVTALGAEIAEDAAATKIVRSQGLSVRVVDRPFAQMIGRRSLRQVWERQVRWARLRRATFLPYYIPEGATGSLVPTVAAALAADASGADPLGAILTLQAIWIAAEALLVTVARWHMTWVSPIAWVLRDLALPAIWLAGFFGNTFTWRGTPMSVARDEESVVKTAN